MTCIDALFRSTNPSFDEDAPEEYKHGFMVVTPEEQPQLLEAAKFMDTNECETVIAAARNSSGLSTAEILENLQKASREFRENARKKFSRDGEW